MSPCDRHLLLVGLMSGLPLQWESYMHSLACTAVLQPVPVLTTVHPQDQTHPSWLTGAWQESALGYERTRWAQQLGPVLRLWESFTPSLFKLSQLALPATSAGSLLDAFLSSEVAFAQQLVVTVGTSLASLSDLVQGAGLLTPQVQVAKPPWLSCTICAAAPL